MGETNAKMIGNNKKRWVWWLLFALNLAFIWGNSMLPGAQSNHISDVFTTALRCLLQWGGTPGGGTIGHGVLSFLVRKAAHMTEFALLGVWSALLFLAPAPRAARLQPVALIGVVVPLIDETIQIFSGRTSMVRDVWIDIAGFALGVGGWALGYVLRARRRAKKRV